MNEHGECPPAPSSPPCRSRLLHHAERSHRACPALSSGRQIRRQHRSDGRPKDSSTTPGLEPPQVERDDDEPLGAPPPEKVAPTPNHPPAAPTPPERRRRELHPTLPYIQAGAGDPSPSRRRSGRRRRGIPRLGGAHGGSTETPKNRLSPLLQWRGGDKVQLEIVTVLKPYCLQVTEREACFVYNVVIPTL
jgi:hypothetical protein